MTGPRAPLPADPAEHPLRASLARGDRSVARSRPALLHLVQARDLSLLSDAVIAQVSGTIGDLAAQLDALGFAGSSGPDALAERLLSADAIRDHCHALATEWSLTLRLEQQQAVDPVLSPAFQALVADSEAAGSDLAIRALAAQARFAQTQRRMALPLSELPAELFHAALRIGSRDPGPAEARARAGYDESETRLALLGRLTAPGASRLLDVAHAGVALWLSALALASGQSRERMAWAAADPQAGRLLLTLRAAGLAAGEAERQVALLHPGAALPRGLHDVGTREAAQWLAEAEG